MVGIEGNILTPVLSNQLTAITRTARALDATQLKLASGKEVNSALDNPQNFFAAQSLGFRASDLNRLLDGIGQSIRTIEEANHGIEASLRTLDQAEAFLVELEQDYITGQIDPVDEDSLLTARIADILAANPEATHIGGGVIVHEYTTVGTVTFTAPDNISDFEYLIVGGGGGGGSSTAFGTAGSGGGGAGGLIEGTLNITAGTGYNVVVGAGGVAGAAGNNSGANGGDSSFGLNVGTNLTGLGGGGGIGGNGNGNDGGSGGGGRGGTGGVALQPGTPQGGLGNGGGTGPSPGGHGGGGGGGAGTVGGANSAISGGTGGDGIQSDITGATQFYAAGGGGGGANADAVGTGGSLIGGNGANDATAATQGVDGTGSGGGGGNNSRVGAVGGSGTVVLSYTVTGDDGLSAVEREYSKILDQLDTIAEDANYRGINLLKDDDLRTDFNEERDNFLITEGIDATSLGLGLERVELDNAADARDKQEQVREARKILRNYGFSIATDITIIQTRRDFTEETVNILKAGSDDLTIADQNKLGAEFLALQTRQAVQFNVLSISAQQNQSAIINLLGINDG